MLTLGPLLGLSIPEPAALTIAALLPSTKFDELNPREEFKYATIGLLFVNVSVGGTLTHFSVPPILMVAASWEWDIVFMSPNLVMLAIVVLYTFLFGTFLFPS